MKDAKLILLVLKIEKPTMENSKHSSYGANSFNYQSNWDAIFAKKENKPN